MKKHRQKKALTVANGRWLAYATAGAATALGSAASSEAEIHYSGILNYRFVDTGAVFPLNGISSLLFEHVNLGFGGWAHIEIQGPGPRESSGGLVGTFVLYGGFYVSNLRPGLNLSQLDFGAYCRFTTIFNCFGGTIGYEGHPNVKFGEPGTGYIGFTFDSGNGPQYGWARIKTDGRPRYRFILLDYAWADPGESIRTGQKQSGADPGESLQTTQKPSSAQTATVPDRGSLGLLALGAAGLIAWRKRRGQATE
jgi:hypothetical protein